MAPPFLAYYAAVSNERLHEAVKQCGHYRQVLQSNTTMSYQGAWEHIIGPKSQDTGIWVTANGWAAAGMTRVLATVMKIPVAQNATWRSEAIYDLTRWIMEILEGAVASYLDGGLVRNYINDDDSSGDSVRRTPASSESHGLLYTAVAKGKRHISIFIKLGMENFGLRLVVFDHLEPARETKDLVMDDHVRKSEFAIGSIPSAWTPLKCSASWNYDQQSHLDFIYIERMLW
ncbi:hypothetical protein C0992_013133 [Termitomyces sp. T32_za158]|nr:hypothetical protein C0992_013133 [Termitomyces sp. T32_za158]